MNHQSLTPSGCRSRLRRPVSGSAPVRYSITSLSTVSSLVQCAALACRTEIIADRLPDFWCVADCLEIANGELWRAVEALQGVADKIEPDDTLEATHGGKDCSVEGRTEGTEPTGDGSDQDGPDDSDQDHADEDDNGYWNGPDGSSGLVGMI